MRTILRAALVAAPVVVLLAACEPRIPRAEPLRSLQARPEGEPAYRVGGKVAKRQVEIGQAVCKGDTPVVLDDIDSALVGGCQVFESIALQEKPK